MWHQREPHVQRDRLLKLRAIQADSEFTDDVIDELTGTGELPPVIWGGVWRDPEGAGNLPSAIWPELRRSIRGKFLAQSDEAARWKPSTTAYAQVRQDADNRMRRQYATDKRAGLETDLTREVDRVLTDGA